MKKIIPAVIVCSIVTIVILAAALMLSYLRPEKEKEKLYGILEKYGFHFPCV